MADPAVAQTNSTGSDASPEAVLERIYQSSGEFTTDHGAAALEHVRLGRRRAPDTAVVGVRRTDGMGVAVQIVTDDMPLLVESVLALLSRLGVSVATVIHPVLSARRTA